MPVKVTVQPTQSRATVLLKLLQLWMLSLLAPVLLIVCSEVAFAINPNEYVQAALKTLLIVGAASHILRCTCGRPLELGRFQARTAGRIILMLFAVEAAVLSVYKISHIVLSHAPLAFSLQPWKWSAGFLEGILLAPIYEEILFRGLLLEWLEAKASAMFPRQRRRAVCNVICSITFGLSHLLGGPAFPLIKVCAAAALSIVLGMAKQRSRGVVLPILCHSLNNIIGSTIG